MNDQPESTTTFQSRVLRVTFYEDRAEVFRGTSLKVPAGTSWVTLPGITPYVDDKSVQAKIVAEGVMVLAARLRRRVVPRGERHRAAREAIVERLEKAREQAEVRRRQVERAERSRDRTEKMFEAWAAALSKVPGRSASAIEGSTNPWRGAYERLDVRQEAALTAWFEARETERIALDEVKQAELALSAGDAQETDEVESRIEVQLRSEGAKEAQLEVRYRTPCAMWRPEHLAKLLLGEDRKTATVELETFATIWQRTQEDWAGIEVELSTARPAAASAPPRMADDILLTRKKTEEEKSTVQIEAREAEVALAGARGPKVVEDLPGVDDGGQPQIFRAAERVNLPSNGEPFRVSIQKRKLAAVIRRSLLSEASGVAHLIAKANLSEGGPLLAGPVRIAREHSFMGRSTLDFVAAGEPFELGFGPEDGIRARRRVTENRDRVPVVGTQKLERKVAVFLSNLSAETKELELTERLPVSEIESVEINALDLGGFSPPDQDGFLRQTVRIEARGTKEIKLRYEVRAKSNVRLPF